MKSFVIAANILRRIGQDRRTLVLIAVLPLLFVLLYGYSFSGEPQHLKLTIVNRDNGLASAKTAELGRVTLSLYLAEAFIERLNPTTFDVTFSEDAETAIGGVGRAGVVAALVFPQYFSQQVTNEVLRRVGERTIAYEGQTIRLLPGEESQMPIATLRLDDSNPLLAPAILQALNAALAEMLAQQQAALEPENLLDVQLLHDGKIRTLDYTAPGIIGFAITLITVMLTAISIVRERTGGTLTRLLIAPVHAWEVSFGYTLAFTSVALLQVAELFLLSVLLFDIRFVGSPAAVALVIVLFTIALQGIATLLSTIAKNEFQAMQFVLFILIPSIMVSGVFWPLEMMPPTIRPLAYLSPLTYANSALRKLMLAAQGLSGVVFEVGVLAGFAVVMLVFGIVSMRRQAHSG